MKITAHSLSALAAWLLASGMSSAADAQESGKAQSTKGGYYGERTAFVISKIDAAAAKEFQDAWHASGYGFARIEALVLLYKADDGSISARSQRKTNEPDCFTFVFTPDIIAVVHTHSNGADPKPAVADMKVADTFLVPMFTLTRRGMYVYDPEIRKISIVRNGLDWLKSSKWKRERLSSGDTHSRAFKPTAKETPQ